MGLAVCAQALAGAGDGGQIYDTTKREQEEREGAGTTTKRRLERRNISTPSLLARGPFPNKIVVVLVDQPSCSGFAKAWSVQDFAGTSHEDFEDFSGTGQTATSLVFVCPTESAVKTWAPSLTMKDGTKAVTALFVLPFLPVLIVKSGCKAGLIV